MNNFSTLLFLGDVVPYKPFRFRNWQKTIINLECPITATGKPISGKINLKVKENYLETIFGASLFAVNLGNNHILDYGLEGLDSTMKELKRSGIPYFGINGRHSNSHNPLITKFNNMDIALISVICETTTPLVEFDDFNYLSLLNTDALSVTIADLRRNVSRVIVYIHWGVEESSYPRQEDIIAARRLIDAGADIVVGSHAHAPQAIERYRDGIIAYNLGNFIMPAFRNMPSYYDDSGRPLSDFTKKLMLWNRISWGLSVDLDSMEYTVRKFAFLADRIIELKLTPLDKYLDLNPQTMNDSYADLTGKHLGKREFRRKLRDFISNPHVPKKFRKLL